MSALSKEAASRTMTGPWYAEGLRFSCTGCGACCTGKGRVWLTEADIMRLSTALKREPHEVVEELLERVEGRWAMREDPNNGDCALLKEHRCTAYEGRPRQCRTFPWWPSTLTSIAQWEEVRRVCEGVEAEGAPLVSFEEIQATLQEELKGRR
jgi:uncharacterized protein